MVSRARTVLRPSGAAQHGAGDGPSIVEQLLHRGALQQLGPGRARGQGEPVVEHPTGDGEPGGTVGSAPRQREAAVQPGAAGGGDHGALERRRAGGLERPRPPRGGPGCGPPRDSCTRSRPCRGGRRPGPPGARDARPGRAAPPRRCRPGPAPTTSTSTAPASGEGEILGAIGCRAAADDHRDRDQEQRQCQAHAAQASATAARVAAKLTPSLSSHEKPPRWSVRVPQRCTGHSLGTSQAGQ